MFQPAEEGEEGEEGEKEEISARQAIGPRPKWGAYTPQAVFELRLYTPPTCSRVCEEDVDALRPGQ